MAKPLKVRCTKCRKDNTIPAASKPGDLWKCGRPKKGGALCGAINTAK